MKETRCARLGAAVVAALLLATAVGAARDDALTGWFDLAVPGGEVTLAALGFRTEERALMLPLLARSLHDRDQRTGVADARVAALITDLSRRTARSESDLTIPVPLDANAWRDILPPVKPPATTDLFFRIAGDRRALLLALGLASTTDGTRALLTRDRELLRFLYQQAPGTFAMVSRHLDIDDGRVIVPGGEDGAAVWEVLAGASPSRPGAFIRALVTRDQGRLAWYYDSIAGLDRERLAAAWPAALPPAERALPLYAAFRDTDPQWRIAEQPLRRGAIDAWMVLQHAVLADGHVASPLPRRTWSLLFTNGRVTPDQVARSLQEAAEPVTLPWLVRETLSPVVGERRVRYEMFRLAQRVFADAPASSHADVAIALHGVRQSRAAMLALERMQVRDAATWAAVAAAARHVNDASDGRVSVVAFQAVIALLERMRHARTLDVRTAEHLLRTLADAVRTDRRVMRSLPDWMVGTLIPALPPLVRPDAWTGRTAYESRVLQALAGPSERHTPGLDWEGLTYVVDPVAAEHERLQEMRALLPSPGLDAALSGQRPRELADALVTLVYATALGDPEGPASLSPDVASRHQFGLSGTSVVRDEMPWSPPEERQGTGPWHIQGALIGLDLGLSRLFLRRIADQEMPQAPTLTLNDLGTLTRTGVGMVPSELEDAHRDELAAAIARGRARVAAARTTADFVSLAEEAGVSHAQRQVLPWLAVRQPEELARVFALRDLLWLGKPALPTAVIDRWGVAAEGVDGRKTLAMPGPRSWEDYAGRSEAGQITTQVPDLTLRLVEETARRRLPAQLVASLLAFALADYWHDVRARFADDWPRLTRHAAIVPSARIADYVAALAGGGPLRAQ